MNTLRRTLLVLIASLSLAPLIAACGGGTGGTGATNNNPSNAVSIGVMAKGSVIVNGVHFDDNAATIKIDERRKGAATSEGDGRSVRPDQRRPARSERRGTTFDGSPRPGSDATARVPPTFTWSVDRAR
jgi:hypothetical protein